MTTTQQHNNTNKALIITTYLKMIEHNIIDSNILLDDLKYQSTKQLNAQLKNIDADISTAMYGKNGYTFYVNVINNSVCTYMVAPNSVRRSYTILNEVDYRNSFNMNSEIMGLTRLVYSFACMPYDMLVKQCQQKQLKVFKTSTKASLIKKLIKTNR